MAIRELVELAGRVAEIERRMAGMYRHGKVDEINAEEAWVRLDFGTSTQGGKFLSPKIPYAQVAGAVKFHTPPSVGQQMTMFAPNGDWQQAVALPLTWSDENKSPNTSPDEHEMTFGNVRFFMKDGQAIFQVGGSTITMTDGEIVLKSAKITTDGPTHLNNGNQPIHRIGDVDSAGDIAVTGAGGAFA